MISFERNEERADAEALRDDIGARRWDKVCKEAMPPPQVLKSAQAAYRFEHGDHQPDGTILPPRRPVPKGHNLQDAPWNRSIANPGFGQGVIGGGHDPMPNFARSPQLQSAMGVVAAAAQAATQRKPEPDPQPQPEPAGDPQGDCLVLRVALQILPEDRAKVQALMDNDPRALKRLLIQLELEASYHLKAHHNVEAVAIRRTEL